MYKCTPAGPHSGGRDPKTYWESYPARPRIIGATHTYEYARSTGRIKQGSSPFPAALGVGNLTDQLSHTGWIGRIGTMEPSAVFITTVTALGSTVMNSQAASSQPVPSSNFESNRLMIFFAAGRKP